MNESNWNFRAIAESLTSGGEIEEALRLQLAVMEAATHGIVITSLDGTIKWVNPAFAVLTGYSREEAVGKNPRDLVNSGIHGPEFFKSLWGTILRGDVWKGEIVNRRKDGTLYNEEQVITPIRGLSGQIQHFVAMKRDITTQKQEAKARLEAEQRYRTLVDEVNDGIFVTDTLGVITFANRALA